MRYQWGRKDPFTFATNSEKWGSNTWETGKYPVKIYTIDGVLIYQDNSGSDNKDKQPAGGVVISWTDATSMMTTIKNPIISYISTSAIINQVGHTKTLWDYYWTSHSRGTDGTSGNVVWHNEYLDGYISNRTKSIYDPCPYGFKVASNGTFNHFKSNHSWVTWSYTGCALWLLDGRSTLFITGANNRHVGSSGYYFSSTVATTFISYNFVFGSDVFTSNQIGYSRVWMFSVRCIEELDSSVRPDRRTRRVY